jgi:hypothetical protein
VEVAIASSRERHGAPLAWQEHIATTVHMQSLVRASSCEFIKIYKIRCHRMACRQLHSILSYLVTLGADSHDIKYETQFVVSIRSTPARATPIANNVWNLAQMLPFGSNGTTRHLGSTSGAHKYLCQVLLYPLQVSTLTLVLGLSGQI